MAFTHFPDLTVESFRKKCEALYYDPARCSMIRRVLVFGLLYNVALEFAAAPVADALSIRCRQLEPSLLANMETAIAELPLNIQRMQYPTLTTGAFKTMALTARSNSCSVPRGSPRSVHSRTCFASSPIAKPANLPSPSPPSKEVDLSWLERSHPQPHPWFWH
jgi:hypothetical protein